MKRDDDWQDGNDLVALEQETSGNPRDEENTGAGDTCETCEHWDPRTSFPHYGWCPVNKVHTPPHLSCDDWQERG